MAIPTWTSGQVLTASDVNTWFVPKGATKTATESVTSSTTLQNDDDLFVSVDANAQYFVYCLIWCDGASTGDIKINFTAPASATMTLQGNGLSGGGAANTDDQSVPMDLSSSTSWGLAGGAGAPRPIQLSGSLYTAGTAGTFRLQWAQATSDVTATRVLNGSVLMLFRIG